jgi:hypothetical protein
MSHAVLPSKFLIDYIRYFNYALSYILFSKFHGGRRNKKEKEKNDTHISHSYSSKLGLIYFPSILLP